MVFLKQGVDNYYINKAYACNLLKGEPVSIYFDSVKDSSVFQASVYEFAKEAIKENGLRSVLDIGCGLGTKLVEIIYPVCKDIVGIDTAHHIRQCQRKYPVGQWLVDDIENPGSSLKKSFDLIISADVIEHLVDPDKLLAYFKRFSNKNTLIIISTPERDRLRNNSFGPPLNKAHIREWNKLELENYLKSRGFIILEHFLVESQKNANDESCQIVFCKNKQ
jgi:SAM-dependent methyltransferase